MDYKKNKPPITNLKGGLPWVYPSEQYYILILDYPILF